MAHQVLGRNLEALVTRAQELKTEWKDKYVSVEHLVLGFLEDMRFGHKLLQGEQLDAKKLEKAIKEIRGSNRVTDQVLYTVRHLFDSEACIFQCQA